MISEIPYAMIISGVALVGLWISNILYDLKVPHYLSRKIGHSAGGVGFLLFGVFFKSAFWPILLSALFTLLLGAARIFRPNTFRGVGGSSRSQNVIAEIWFVGVALPVLLIGWLWLDKPFIAIACLLFMAWGDCVTGLIRHRVYGRAVKGLWGSLGMLLVCLTISLALIKPFWAGAFGSIMATAAEWSFGDVGIFKWGDDNWAIPLVSLASILGVLSI
jgi:phytol kinase